MAYIKHALVFAELKLGVRHIQIIYMVACSMAMTTMRGSIGIVVLAINDVERRNDTYIHVSLTDHSTTQLYIHTCLSCFIIERVQASHLVKCGLRGISPVGPHFSKMI
jgi:hypothetical protein